MLHQTIIVLSHITSPKPLLYWFHVYDDRQVIYQRIVA